MSANLGMKDIKVRTLGTLTNVPNNAIARLMYYLDCVLTVIDYKDLVQGNFGFGCSFLKFVLKLIHHIINGDDYKVKDRTLIDYQNYDELSVEELLAVYKLAKLLNPSLFINYGIFYC